MLTVLSLTSAQMDYVLYPVLLFNTSRPRKNGRIFQMTLSNTFSKFNENISLKFVHKGPVNNIIALGQIMLGAIQAASHYLNQWWLVYWRIYTSLGLNELNNWVSTDGQTDWSAKSKQ